MIVRSRRSDGQRSSELPDKNVGSGSRKNTTTNEHQLALKERLNTGSKSWGDVQKDKYQYDYHPSFQYHPTARTTFYAEDADDETKYNRLYALHHGRQHPAERRANGFSRNWDQRVRQDDVWKLRRSRVILSQADVRKPFKKWAVQKVMRENLQGFSVHYQGLDGAAIGFATLYKYDDVEEAKSSYLVDEAEEMLDVDGEGLVDYVWRKYGDDVQ